MRDEGRIKEKIELRLDTRQVVSIVLGAAVSLGVSFYLGVTVGKDLSASAQPPPPADRLAALDDAAAARKVAGKITFPEALTDGETAQEPGRPSPEVVAMAAALAPKPPPPPGAEPPAPPPPAAPVAAPTPETPPAPVVVAPPAPPPPAPERPLPSAAELLAAADKRAPPADPARAALPPPGETRSDAGVTPPMPPPPADGFTVQAGASPERGEAEALVGKLRSKGLSPYIVTAEVAGKGTFHRVRVGRFPTRDAADRYLQDFKRETGIAGFVTAAGK